MSEVDAGPVVFGRYVLVTAVASPLTFALYGALLWLTALGAGAANVLAAAIVVVPTFFGYRNWVWRVATPDDVGRQATLFWVFSGATVTAGTAVASSLEGRDASDAQLVAAVFATYAVVWLARFFFLDALFRKEVSP